MTSISMAHVNIQGLSCAIFDADSTTHTDQARNALLARLTLATQQQGLRVEKAALAFVEFGQLRFFGSPDLVRYLARAGLPRMTHTLTVS
jgi:hypothetical protein